MALSKVDYNSLNVTATASKALKWNSGADGFETGDVAGALVLLETITADGSGTTITFDSNIDSTYKEYQIHFTDVHPATNDVDFSVNFRDGSTAYDATKTSTYFSGYHEEDDSPAQLSYETAVDLAQATGVQPLTKGGLGNGNDECLAGILHLYDPSSTTFVTHFISQTNNYYYSDYFMSWFVTGYCNVTAAIDGVQFTFSSGNIDAGTFKLYGIKDS